MPPKSGKEVGDPFAGLDGSSSAAEDAAMLHGTQLGSVQSIRVIKVPLYDIQPDPLQPRRIIPNELRDAFHGDAQAFLRHWIAEAQIDPMLYFGEDFEIPVYEQPFHEELQKVLLLARSIKDTGLTNPITVIRSGRSSYVIETGERRWFSFQLLYSIFGEEFAEMPARVMNERSVWRQASENNQRADLNAIAKARQYALLVMDVLDKQGERITPLESFETEREFYAQIADARIPHGYSDKIQNAMGFSSRVSLMRHRDLLRLPNPIWNLADDYNCPESVLREFLGETLENQLAWFKLWLEERSRGNNVSDGNNLKGDVSNGNNLDKNVSDGNNSDEKVSTGNNSDADEIIKNFNKSSKQISQLFLVDASSLTKKKRQEYRQSIQAFREILDNLEARLDE